MSVDDRSHGDNEAAPQKPRHGEDPSAPTPSNELGGRSLGSGDKRLAAQGFELELAANADEDEKEPDVKKSRPKGYPIWAGIALAFWACTLISCAQAEPTPTEASGSSALLQAAMTRTSPSAAAPSSEAATEAPALGAVGEPVRRVQFPSLGIDAPIVEVSWHLAQVEGQTLAEWDTVQNAAGHHRGTAGLDGVGNCVLAGHSNPEGGVFQGLWELQTGDAVVLTDNDGRQYRYLVSEVHKLQETGADLAQRRANAAWMAPTADTRLTLVTCWPESAYTHRVIVVARPG